MIAEKQGLFYRIRSEIPTPRRTRKVIILTWVISAFLLAVILFASMKLKVPVGNLTRDPMQIVDAPFYTGILSNVGILFWCSTAVVCLFSFLLLNKSGDAYFLFAAGIFTLLLLLDDLFLFHEVVYRNYLHIPQRMVFFIYLVSLVYLLYRFRVVIFHSEYTILLTALVMFLLSGFIDALPQNILPAHHLFEDGSKFIGIIFWFLYFVRTSYSLVHKPAKDIK